MRYFIFRPRNNLI
ncbi:hypothetical protein OEA_29220 (plasmid) [Priestia megaterium NCT-2]|nr:hypothetical protein OEA_29220 [Priestia megaterium NCT-2]